MESGGHSHLPIRSPASARWEALAQQKLAEVDALIRRAQTMKRVLEEELLRAVVSHWMSALDAYVIKARAKR